ncbi:hypothetical protein BSL78_04617 [Apostichopus japonicus]|uniref:Uncharacterized protein n=1 Tax=Stichopus japonicus TaxID=307972 RepID=A0A2G8LDZ8_STIJA|nr:hypothetical protein BSL78_04617 [Apostichopus japonicus]
MTLDFTNVRCCDNPSKTCSPPRPLALSIDNVLSLVQYPIRPTSMAVSKKTDSDVDFRDDLWYSLYEFEEPFLNQSLDLCLTFDLPDASTHGVCTRLNLNHKFRGIKQAETYTSVRMRQRQSLGEDYIRTNQFLLIRELAVEDNQNRQTTADQTEYVVLSQSPTNNIPDDRNCFVEQSQCYIDVGQRQCLKQRCMDSTSCYRYILADGLFSENKSISRDRKAVAFNTQESIILTISIDFGSGNRISLVELPKEIRKQTKILAVLIRNLLGASVNYMLDNLMHVIRYCIATYGREVDLQVSRGGLGLGWKRFNRELTVFIGMLLYKRGFIIIMSLLLFVKLITTRNSYQPSRRVSCNDLIIQYTADNTGSVDHDTVTTDNIDTEETEIFLTPMLTPRNSSSSTGVEFRSRMKVILKESVPEGCLSHLMGSTDQTGYDSDYMLDRCLSERDVTLSKYGKKVQRSIITPSYITSLLRDDDVINAFVMSRNETRSSYTSDDYDSSLTSTDFSSHMLSTSSASSDSLTSSSTASSISLPPSAVAINEATLATGDATNIQLDEPTPAVSECTINFDIPLNHRDLIHTEITEQLTGTGNLPNGLFYPNLEEPLLFLSLIFFKNQFFN